MPVYRFVGSTATKEGAFSLDQFGQEITLSEELAREVILEGVALVPAAQFDRFGFTKEELKAYPTVDFQNAAPESFHGKRVTAWKWMHEYRESLKDKGGLSAPVASVPQEALNG